MGSEILEALMRIAFIKPSESEEIIDVLLTAYGEWRTAKNTVRFIKNVQKMF